jgi:HEAT repeat protein
MPRLIVVMGAIGWVVLAAAQVSAAPAAPTGPAPGTLTAKADLDGDGAPDTCTLTPDGHLTVVAASGARLYDRDLFDRATAAARPGTPRLRVHQVRPGGAQPPLAVLEARVPLRKTAGAELVVVLGGRPVREIFRDRVGPVGRDAEWSRHLVVTPDAVLRFQRALNVARCDGGPTYLYPEVFDFKAGRFAPQVPAAPPTAASRVAATRQPPAGAPAAKPISPFLVSSASTVLGAGNAGELTPPVWLTDDKRETAWITNDPHGGRGQLVTIRSRGSPFRVKALRIVPGHGLSAPAYAYYSRLRTVELVFDRAKPVAVEFPSELAGPKGHGAAYWVVLPEPVATTCVTMIIGSTFPGRPKPPDVPRTAVAEVTVYSERDFGVPLPQIIAGLVADLAAGAGGEAVKRLIVQQGPAAEPHLLAALPNASGVGRAMVVEALAEVATPAAASELGRVLDAGEREHRAAAGALKRLGAAAVPALATLLADGGAPPRLRARVAAQLGAVGGEAAVRALLGSLPGAPDEVRNAVAKALPERPPAVALSLVVDQLASASDARHRADLLRAVALTAATAGAESRGRAAAVVRAAAPQARGFEERFRLAQACGALRDPVLAPLLDGLLAAADPELREAAAAAASDLPAAAAAPLLGRALKDGSPEVRRTAATGLARRREVPLEAEIADRLGNDRWPLVRREAATALAERCAAQAARVPLRRAVDDADREVARTALRALVACRDPGVGKLLLAVIGSSKRPALLRETAAAGVGALGDRSLAPAAARLLDELRTEPGTDDRGESLTITLALALGRLGDERALGALRQASVDPASGRVRAAAVEAIAAICPAGAAKVFQEAEADKDHRVAGAARAGRARCRR